MKKNFAECVVFTALLAMAMTVISSCKDDDTEITDPGTDVVTVDSTLLKSDAEVYKYIMDQFVELNLDGTLSERTRFYQQLNEADSTALYAHTKTKAEARELFLQLLPDENRKLVTVNKDSSEMSYAFSNGLRSLTYSESKSGSVVATVTLPSEGNYKKYANSLTMIKSFGTNAGTYRLCDVLGIYREFEIPMYFASQPSWFYDTSRNSSSQEPCWSQSQYQIQIRKKKVHMHCFYVDVASDRAYFAFVTPCSASADLKDATNQDYPYLVQHFQSYFMNPLNVGKNVNYFVNADEYSTEDVLPSAEEVRTFLRAFFSANENSRANLAEDDRSNLLFSYSDLYLMCCSFFNNYDKIVTSDNFLEQIGAGDDCSPTDAQANYLAWYGQDTATMQSNGLFDLYREHSLYKGWATGMDPQGTLRSVMNYLQFYQSRFFYFPTDDNWTIIDNAESVQYYPNTNECAIGGNYDNWSTKYPNYDLVTTFASKDFFGDSASYDESDYFFASESQYTDSVTGEQHTAEFTEASSQWTILSKNMTGDNPRLRQKYLCYDYPADSTMESATEEEKQLQSMLILLRGREVRNPTPLRIVYIKSVPVSSLGIEGVGATQDDDDTWYLDSYIESVFHLYGRIKNAAASWQQEKTDRGVVY